MLFYFRSPTPPRKENSKKEDTGSISSNSVPANKIASNASLPKQIPEQDNQNCVREENISDCEAAEIDNKCETKEELNNAEEDEMLLRTAHGVVAVDPRHAPPMAVVYAGPPSIQMATWGDRNGSSRSGRARSAHGQAPKGSPNVPSYNMRSASAGGPSIIGGTPPPVPPLPMGYTSMHYNPTHPPHPGMVHPATGQPSMVLVPQPYPSHGATYPSQIQHIHAPYQHPAHYQASQKHGSKHHQHHMVEQMIPEGNHLIPQPPVRDTKNIPKSNGGTASNR